MQIQKKPADSRLPGSTGRPRRRVRPWWLLVVLALALPWSMQGPSTWDVWAFEIVPATLGVIGLITLAGWFRFSRFVYCWIAAAYVLIAIGARYTYAEVPVFRELSALAGLSRNGFDRVGHLVQGLTVALLAREVLLRGTALGRAFAVPFLTACVALAFSAFYEVLECWCVLVFYPGNGPEWLGLQGDEWDAQWDMTMALAGSLIVILLLRFRHDASIRRLGIPVAGAEDAVPSR